MVQNVAARQSVTRSAPDLVLSRLGCTHFLSKCKAEAEPTPTGSGSPQPGSGAGSETGGGGMGGMGSRCACVDKGMGGSTGSGSGPGPLPPTGSGSGSGPLPPTVAPTGSGSGSGPEYEYSGPEYFVSTEGSDDENVAGTISAPWQTLNHAIEELRKVRPKTPGPADNATITLMGGVYYLASEIQLGSKDQYLIIQK